MRFGNPGWLAAVPLACLLLALLWRFADRRRSAALEKFVSAHLRADLTRSMSVGRRRLQRGLFSAAIALLCAALSQPQWGYRWEQVNRRGNEIVFAVDTSRSMSAPDVKPTRLARAKLAIDDFANRLDGDAVGIVAFAGSAYLTCPITLDYAAFHESLAALDTNTIPHGGTNISSAIAEAQAALNRRAGSDKILILVTDGEDLEGSAVAAAERAKQRDGLKIFTVGVGTASGELIPVPADQGGGFVKDDSGQFVKSKLDEPALKAIAAATGGFYAPLGSQGEGLETIEASVLRSLTKHDLASRQQKIYTERYQWPLAASWVALLLSLLIGTRRRDPKRKGTPAASVARSGATTATRATAAAAHAAVAAVALFMTAPHPARAAAPTPEDTYNSGTAAYRAGEFSQAVKAFEQSISGAPSNDAKRLADQQDAYYNLGNALYRNGQKSVQSSTEETLKKWNDAVKAYDTALQLRRDDADSKYNRDLVKRKIEQLKQQQQNQQQKQDQNQNKDPKNPPQKQDRNSQQKGQAEGQGQPNQQNPPPPPSAQNGAPKSREAQPPPGSQGNPQPDKPPPGAAAPQPRAQDPSDPKPNGNDDPREADNRHAPGQMSREEARELLDSVKGDEKRQPVMPLAQRDDEDQPPERPFKNW